MPVNVNYIISESVAATNLGTELGKLKFEYDDGETSPFELLDCFDQSIRKSGRVLVRVNETLQLLQGDGVVLAQQCNKQAGLVSALADGQVKRALTVVSPLRSLLVVGRGKLHYCRMVAVDDDHKTHVRAHFQRFQVEGGDRQITLVTLQALRGYDSAYEALRLHIANLNVESVADIASMYTRLIADYEEYDPKPKITISRDELAFQAANDIVSTYIGVARLNEQGMISDSDTEFLHDYRVSLRKVRSVISLFKGVYEENQTLKLKQSFSALMAPTGRLRDLDVYFMEHDQYYDLLPESLHDGLDIMFDLFAKERNNQHKSMIKRLKSSAYTESINEMATLFSSSTGLQQGPNADRSAWDYACELIWKRYRKVCKIARAIDNNTEDEEVHELRIHCKKLRYLMEFFSPLFSNKKIKSLIKPLKTLQDNLGLFNDYSVQQVSMQEFLTNHVSRGREQDLTVAKSVGAIIAILHQQQLAERALVVSNFAVFDSEDIRQQFRQLFHRVD